MESLNKLEATIEGWLKPVPHLPEAWRKWLSTNVWWLVLIGVVLSAFGAVTLLFALMAAMAWIGSVTSVYGALGVSTVYTGWWYAASFASLAFLAVTVVINAIAISPLKAMKRKGWDLLFLVFVIGIVSQVVNIVLNFNSLSWVGGIISGVISAAIGAYFLFEIRSYFK